MQKGLKNPGGELFDDDPLENVNDTPSPSQVREYARCQGTKEAFSDSNEVVFMVKTCLLTRDRIYCADGCREMSLEHKWESGSKDIGLECTLSVFRAGSFQMHLLTGPESQPTMKGLITKGSKQTLCE